LAYFGHFAMTLLYAIVLTYSASGERIWLKRSGILVLIICVFDLSLVIFPNVEMHPVVREVVQITNYVGLVLFIFFLLNFQEEIKDLPLDSGSVIDTPLYSTTVKIAIFIQVLWN